ncbi:MAG: DNA/RNA non-specific endonuclease [Parvibaculaceae bacterium]
MSEHIYGGAPTGGPLLVRRGYVTSYDSVHRVPRWTAWHVTSVYVDTPRRKNRWKRFRTDPDTADAVTNGDYTNIPKVDVDGNEDFYARGHLAPYFVSGGDRDNDGIDAEIEEDLNVEDIDDACTVFEINYMTNIAPQLHNSLNGSGGPWYKVEALVRQQAKDGEELHVLAGTIFGDAPIKTVGNPNDNRPDTVGVPHMFWKVIVSDGHAFGFLFEHDAQLHPDGIGCPLKESDVRNCLVPVTEIEALAGIDLFAELETTDANAPIDVGAVLAQSNALFGE